VLEPTLAAAEIPRPTQVQVSLGALRRNLAQIQAHVGGAQVMPILKANAYGHGMVAVGRALEEAGARCFGVAVVEEGILLRQAGVMAPILVMGGILGSQIPLFLEHGLTLTASSVDKLLAIDEAACALGRRAQVHLKIDTGMERIGVHWYSAGPLLEASLRCRAVEVEGIYSHLANSDEPDPARTHLQLERFAEVLDFYPRHGLPHPIRHIANSAGILQHPDSWLDLVRPGIALYGVRPDPALVPPFPLEPALRWYSRVVYFKVVRAHHPVSYGSTWAPEVDGRVVTVPVGYGDGYFRALSNRAELLIRGQRWPQVGRICMDQLMVHLGQGSAWNGDEVVLIGRQGEEELKVEELALLAGTIPYEVLTNINTRVPREHVEDFAPT
jgi:alanine racemase